MEMGMVGLGRTGGNMVLRLLKKGHRPIACDRSDEAVQGLEAAPAITLALYERLRSRLEDTFTDKMLAMMRNQFGGHAVVAEQPVAAGRR
jgi:6-phosphogluconate dehydrogenase (decarboxylating)